MALSVKDQLEILKAAFDDVTQSKPFLPSADSVLPALIALRKTHRTMVSTRSYLASQAATLAESRRRLEADQSARRDGDALRDALRRRIEALKHDAEARRDMTASQVARERVEELRRRKKRYDTERTRLLRGLKRFIDARLGPMLAAEEMGGPVVGDEMDLDLDDGADEAQRGARRRLGRGGRRGGGAEVDSRQRRIDDFLGRGRQGDGDGEGAGRSGGRDREQSEAVVAGKELRELTEALLNQLMDSGGDGSAAYVELDRESAAARFLVRSQVAQFHPRDSSRLRLVDFGRELDD